MEDLSDLERGQMVGTLLAGASVTKAATLLGVLQHYEVVPKFLFT
jgi:hypothetical protein